ncbi:MAG: alanine--tRNA ligase [Dehalococcoidia bacterium]|nr:MAG: alanine--tRNA ligase [Dehalococcoidia bacterium]
MTGDEIRAKFLAYFEERGHKVIPSSSLIPHGDPTLLLTTAGMVQLKPYFMGQAKPPHTRLASCQKCFRTTDIESVGDASHLTFFEMLGNFSVGDYFKAEAVAFAWEFITVRLGIPKERLWTTVYLDDDEAMQLWRKMGVPAERIVRLGEEDNFWGPAGDSGPCGPCSEIHYDFGEAAGCGKPDCNPSCKCGRFCEIWNLVFMQYNQDKQGNRTPLPKPNIDTGMGLERVTAVMQGKNTVYLTDIFQPLLKRASEITGKKYGANAEDDRSMRVVAEHGRAVAFLIADGVLPSNEGRGYVLRRLLRRGVLFGRRLGLDKPFLVDMAAATIEQMGKVYLELVKRRAFILDVVRSEEERFEETLSTGLDLLDEIMAREETKVRMRITGEAAFKLYDTYGFPVEITREIASSRGFEVDIEGFEREMDKQREKARSAHKFGGGEKGGAKFTGEFEPTRFTGYAGLKESTRVAGIIVANEGVNEIATDQKAGIVLEDTPFYAEMGGQVGDTGQIKAEGGLFTVTNTIKLGAHTTLHQGYVAEGSFAVGDAVIAEVDPARRADIARNHTATHLLHYALRQVLGEHVQQRGSLVEPLRLRFDFSHLAPLAAEEIDKIQDIVNAEVRHNHPVYDKQMSYKEAVVSGAIALFDEKYGDVVRVLSIGRPAISTELCGGTHVAATGEIGIFQIVSEASVGSGLRRIEAVTGREAMRIAVASINTLQSLGKLLDSAPEGVMQKVQALLASRDAEIKRAEIMEREAALKDVSALLTHAVDVDGVKLLAVRVKPARPETVREVADALTNKLGSAVVVLGTVSDEKPYFVVSVTPDLTAKGYHAGNLIRQVAAITGGGGGGKPGLAQGGGKDVSKLDEAISAVPGLLKKK